MFGVNISRLTEVLKYDLFKKYMMNQMGYILWNQEISKDEMISV